MTDKNFQKTPATESKTGAEGTFFNVGVLSYLPFANIFESFVEMLKL